MHAFYVHGFASSPGSGKAAFYRQRLAEHGVSLDAPDFNLPEFQSLTITRMLDQLDAAIDAGPAGPVVLIGSSLGGFVAWHAADRRNRVSHQPRPVTHLVLLAPAFDFASASRVDPIVDEWRRTGTREVFHHAFGRSMPVGFALYEDAQRFDSRRVNLSIPVLIFQGTRDTIVPASTVVEFARGRQQVRLRLLDDNHQLQGHLPEIWRDSAEFLGLDER
jgi:pimeloyl-ACP methyl ester carboxylesterase